MTKVLKLAIDEFKINFDFKDVRTWKSFNKKLINNKIKLKGRDKDDWYERISNLEQLNKMVYDLYQLTNDEKKY